MAPAKNHIRCVWQRLDMQETRGLHLEEGGSIHIPSPSPVSPPRDTLAAPQAWSVELRRGCRDGSVGLSSALQPLVGQNSSVLGF